MTDEINRILAEAEAHAASAEADVQLASTRAEQIRLSVRATEARRLANEIATLHIWMSTVRPETV